MRSSTSIGGPGRGTRARIAWGTALLLAQAALASIAFAADLVDLTLDSGTRQFTPGNPVQVVS
ncbi:MAG: hypothetical protein Q8L54_14860 [Devosia sp.]|nr:hypothetical protein [Devosia sp.]